MEDVNQYLEKLKLKAIIYDDEIEEDFNYPECRDYITSEEFINQLDSFLTANECRKILLKEKWFQELNTLNDEPIFESGFFNVVDSKVKDNILIVLNFIRANTKEYNEQINEMICTLNTSWQMNTNEFYQEEYLKRNGCFNERYKKYYPESFFEEYYEKKEVIRYSMTLDYDTINQLLELDDDEIDEVINNQLLNEYTINTFNVLIYDCPLLLKNERFVKRMKYVLKKIKEKSLSINRIKEENKCLNVESAFETFKVLRRIRKNR